MTRISRHSARHFWKKGVSSKIAMLSALACALVGVVGSIAHADMGGRPGYYINIDGGVNDNWKNAGSPIGVGPNYGSPADAPEYCIEIDDIYKPENGEWREEHSTEMSIAAFLMENNKADRSDPTQGAVGFAIHDHFDIHQDSWSKVLQAGFRDITTSQLQNEANALWNEAASKTPAEWNVDPGYTQGKESGTLHIKVLNALNQPMKGIRMSVRIEGEQVVLNNHAKNFEQVADGNDITIPWSAQATGKFTVHVSVPTLKTEHFVTSNQEVLRVKGAGKLSKDFTVEMVKAPKDAKKSDGKSDGNNADTKPTTKPEDTPAKQSATTEDKKTDNKTNTTTDKNNAKKTVVDDNANGKDAQTDVTSSNDHGNNHADGVDNDSSKKHTDQGDKTDKTDKADKPNKVDKSDKANEPTATVEHNTLGKTDNDAKSDQLNRSTGDSKTDNTGKTDNVGKLENTDKSNNNDKADASHVHHEANESDESNSKHWRKKRRHSAMSVSDRDSTHNTGSPISAQQEAQADANHDTANSTVRSHASVPSLATTGDSMQIVLMLAIFMLVFTLGISTGRLGEKKGLARRSHRAQRHGRMKNLMASESQAPQNPSEATVANRSRLSYLNCQ